MSFVFQAVLEFFLSMSLVGRDPPFAFRDRPLWQRIPLIVLTVGVSVVMAVILTLLVIGLSYVIVGGFRGLTS